MCTSSKIILFSLILFCHCSLKSRKIYHPQFGDLVANTLEISQILQNSRAFIKKNGTKIHLYKNKLHLFPKATQIKVKEKCSQCGNKQEFGTRISDDTKIKIIHIGLSE